MSSHSVNFLFIISLLCFFSFINSTSLHARKRISNAIAKSHKFSNKQKLLQVSAQFNFPDLLDYSIPDSSQACSYFKTLKTQFQDAIVELENMGFTLDTTPAKIEDTFTEMRDNFTAYNGRDGDQLEQDILNYTDEIISKAPKILTLTQRSEYLDNLNTSLTEIKRYYDNDACTFEVQIKSYTNQNSLCVGADDVATLVEDAQITENCDNFVFEFAGFASTTSSSRNYCIKSSLNNYYLRSVSGNTLSGALADDTNCGTLWQTGNSRDSDYYNFEDVSAGDSVNEAEKFTLIFI